MLRLNIKNSDSTLYGYMDLQDQAALDAYVATCTEAGSYWTTEASGCTTETVDVGVEPILADIREKRNALLAACDYTQLADSPLSAEQKQAWAEYRQALRDITKHVEADGSVVWPEKPA